MAFLAWKSFEFVLPKTVSKIFVISAPQSDISVFFTTLGGKIPPPKMLKLFFPLRKKSPISKNSQKQSSKYEGDESPPQAPLNFKFFPPVEKTKKNTVRHLGDENRTLYFRQSHISWTLNSCRQPDLAPFSDEL